MPHPLAAELDAFQRKRFPAARSRALPETLEAAKRLTIQGLVEAAVGAWDWRRDVRAHLTRYDEAHSFVQMYRAVSNQLAEKNGTIPIPLLIGSEFYRTVNRRYQPMHMWPTYVSNKERKVGQPSGEDEDDEDDVDVSPAEDGPEKSYRKKWFKARHPKTREPCALVGIDVSSSQTQIVATFLSSATLEQDTMETKKSVAFKETLAQIAYAKHQDPNDDFVLRTKKTLKWPNPASTDYSGPNDPQLQNLCKGLWMTISYGGTIRGVVRDPVTYGLAWTTENASRFLQTINERYPSMKAFLSACRYIADSVVDPKAGFVFEDPFDQSVIRWNPVARKDRYVDVGDGKVALSLPRGCTNVHGTFEKDAEYPVDGGALRRMLAPCLVHTLDAYYSSLVMERLAARRSPTSSPSTIAGLCRKRCWITARSATALRSSGKYSRTPPASGTGASAPSTRRS
jgi:hypothetical protein